VRTLRQAAKAALPCPVHAPEADLSPRQAAWLFVAPLPDLDETETSLLARLREASESPHWPPSSRPSTSGASPS
jgi:hypothetical protein